MNRFAARFAAFLAVLIAPLLGSCSDYTPTETAPETVASGVLFARGGTPGHGFQTLAVDLRTADVVPTVAAQNVTRTGNNFVGDAFVVREWCAKRGAIGGINGGFFGKSYDDLGMRKQIVQLAVTDGKVVAPGSDTPSTRTPGERYLRSAVGFDASGTPEIAWATGTVKNVLRAYGSPINPGSHVSWSGVRGAVACGPRLFAGGIRRICDKEERLVSAGELVRAFVAYDTDGDNKPVHFVMGRADAATYPQVADFLAAFFKTNYQSAPAEAMCLDGGASGQLVRTKNGVLVDAEPTGVRVPTAVLLVPKGKATP